MSEERAREREKERERDVTWCNICFLLSSKSGEGSVARDDLDTSVYYVKDALDANITYAPGTQAGGGGEEEEAGEGEEKEEEEEEDGEGEGGQDVDMPDIGEGRNSHHQGQC